MSTDIRRVFHAAAMRQLIQNEGEFQRRWQARLTEAEFELAQSRERMARYTNDLNESLTLPKTL
jgi:hypothetical protein